MDSDSSADDADTHREVILDGAGGTEHRQISGAVMIVMILLAMMVAWWLITMMIPGDKVTVAAPSAIIATEPVTPPVTPAPAAEAQQAGDGATTSTYTVPITPAQPEG